MPTHALTHDLISSGRTRPTHLVLEVLIHELLPPALAFHLPVLGLAHFAHAEGAIPEQQHQVVADPPKGILHPEPGTSQSISDAPPPGPHREPIRRTPRKPVPQYNLADPALASPPPPAHASDSSSREERMCTGRSQDWLNLSHKASFGAEGRTVHYLIPDMPLPQLN
ncbi:hypothetical protein C8R44DRAFT_889791 [Mycena epipterygia]|nr:hypothetical protein C8R44DRAFT_889791 [Mycena epipterygia]